MYDLECISYPCRTQSNAVPKQILHNGLLLSHSEEYKAFAHTRNFPNMFTDTSFTVQVAMFIFLYKTS